MKKTVMIVASAEGFSIRGIKMKLDGIGVESIYSPPVIKDIEEKLEKTTLVVIYLDDEVAMATEALVYLKDRCMERHQQILVIGQREDYENILGYIPESMISEFFERPLVMDSLLDSVEECLEHASQYAKRKSILIVDDDVAYMTMIMDWIKDSYRVSLVNSGVEAIVWLAKNEADLILLDYEMPVTTGAKILEMLRSDPATCDIPVMFLTGKGDKQSVMNVLSLKPEGYLLKNIDRKGLRDNINQFFLSREKTPE